MEGSTITVNAYNVSTILDGHTISALLSGNAMVGESTTLSIPRTSSGSSANEAGSKDAFCFGSNVEARLNDHSSLKNRVGCSY